MISYPLQVRNGQELSAREESALANMTLAEAEEGRRQLMRMRALQSYQADKLKRQNKIKSKKYRKLLRKSREKVSEVVSSCTNEYLQKCSCHIAPDYQNS